MKENLKIIADAFKNAGLDTRTAEFSITEYSLNTDMSFKFDNLKEFLEFLELSDPADEKKIESIHNTLIEGSIDPRDFFYVNFYRPGIAEL